MYSIILLLLFCPLIRAQNSLGPEGLLEFEGLALEVEGYSVPILADWNLDGTPDLIVGEGGGGASVAGVRIYLHSGASMDHAYSDYHQPTINSSALLCPGSG